MTFTQVLRRNFGTTQQSAIEAGYLLEIHPIVLDGIKKQVGSVARARIDASATLWQLAITLNDDANEARLLAHDDAEEAESAATEMEQLAKNVLGDALAGDWSQIIADTALIAHPDDPQTDADWEAAFA